NRIFIIFYFFIGDSIKWVLCIRCFVNSCIMLKITLYYSFRCSTHQNNLIIVCVYVSIL
ncbi:hypothetical protein FWK35_00019123, partial [Aphis craccivora]